jgi:hypothetical protein
VTPKAALLLFAVAATPAAARQVIDVFGSWGAFQDASPRACYAIAEPVPDTDHAPGLRPTASIASWPGQGVRNQLHVRLSRSHDPRGRVTLSIGERRFELVAGATDAWAPDPATDRAIVSAMRAGRSMSVEAAGVGGQPFADVYALKGAATAIDAAALACLR